MTKAFHSLLAGAALLTLAGCGAGPGAAAPTPPPPPEVGVVVVQPESYTPVVRLPGRVSAFLIAEVRPQIGGIVRSRNFTEGSTVRAGQVLYQIEPASAQAEFANARAAAASAQARYERYQRLIDINAVSRQELDDARAAADQANAAQQTAQINLNYTRVTAPISGIIGVSAVTAGALASPAQAEPFATIQQIDRVYVDLTRSSAEMMELRGQSRNQASVRLIMPDGSYYPVIGRLEFSDVTVNPATGAVTLRAVFPNPNHVLLPGMFVSAEVSQPTRDNVVLAPQRGVTRNARGEATALIVNAQGKVEERILQTGETAGDRWVVLSGLNAGDKLIVEGFQRVQPGAQAIPAPMPAPPQREGSIDLRGRQG